MLSFFILLADGSIFNIYRELLKILTKIKSSC